MLDNTQSKDPDDVFRAHWVCDRVARDLAPLMPPTPLNPVTNWQDLPKSDQMTLVMQLLVSTPTSSSVSYEDMLSQAYQEVGKDRGPLAPLEVARPPFPTILPSQLHEDDKKRLLLAARLDGRGHGKLTDLILASTPTLREIHDFARAAQKMPQGADRENLRAILATTREAKLDREYLSAVSRTSNIPAGQLERLLSQSPSPDRPR